MKKLPIIIGAALLVLGLGGFLAKKMLLSGGGGKAAKAETPAQLAKAAEKERRSLMKKREQLRADGPTVSLGEPLLVNLADPGLAHFAKFSVTLKVDKQSPMAAAGEGATGAALEEAAEIRDIVRTDAQAYTASQLVTHRGQQRLKSQIAADVSAETETLPLAVYFPDLAVQ